MSSKFLPIFFSEVAQPEASNQQFNLTSAIEEQTSQKQDISSSILYQQLLNIQNHQHSNTSTKNLHHSKTQIQHKNGLIYKNYKFHLTNKNKNFINWRCANYRKTRCPAVFHTTLNFEPLFQKHPHISACEPVSPLDRTHSQQEFEGVKSSAGSQSAFEDNLEFVTDSVHEKNKIKGFECKECHIHFLLKTHLKAHMKSVHLSNKSGVYHTQYTEKGSLDHHKPETSGMDG